MELLPRFEYPDAKQLKTIELKDFLFMAISDFEPSEAAAILLDYKLSDVLTVGQIDNLSHEMLRIKVSENYTERLTRIYSTLTNCFIMPTTESFPRSR